MITRFIKGLIKRQPKPKKVVEPKPLFLTAPDKALLLQPHHSEAVGRGQETDKSRSKSNRSAIERVRKREGSLAAVADSKRQRMAPPRGTRGRGGGNSSAGSARGWRDTPRGQYGPGGRGHWYNPNRGRPFSREQRLQMVPRERKPFLTSDQLPSPTTIVQM